MKHKQTSRHKKRRNNVGRGLTRRQRERERKISEREPLRRYNPPHPLPAPFEAAPPSCDSPDTSWRSELRSKCLRGRRKPDVLRPSIAGMRGSMARRLRPCMISSTPLPPPAPNKKVRMEFDGGEPTPFESPEATAVTLRCIRSPRKFFL